MQSLIATLAAAAARARWRAAVSLSVVLTGCASFQAKPIDPQAAAVAFESRSLDPGPWALARLQAEAALHNPDLATLHARRLVAEAAVITAGARPNPGLAGSAQKNTDAAPDTNAWTYGVGLSIPIETAGKRGYRIARAVWLEQAAVHAEAEVFWQVRARVLEAYIGAYPIDSLARERSLIQAELSAEIQRRLAAGLVSSGEALLARVAARQSVLLVEDASRRRVDHLRALASAVGVSERAIFRADLPFTDLSNDELPKVAAMDVEAGFAARTRPDVLSALAEYEAAQTALELEVARQYPDLSIGPGYSWDAGAVKWSLALGLILPLFDRNQGPIAEAEARRAEAAAKFRAVQEQAIADIETARAAYAQAIRVIRLTRVMADDQRMRLHSAELAFQAGATDRLALLAARLDASLAESTRVDALLDAHRAAGRLETALRQSLTSPSSSTQQQGQP